MKYLLLALTVILFALPVHATSTLYSNSTSVGIGTTSPVNPLDVSGAVAIGTSYAGTDTAPTNGLIVQGNVGIGTASPAGTLDIEGGTATTATNGSSINIVAQSAGTGNQNGGNIILTPGTATGTGTAGGVGIGTVTPGTLLYVNGVETLGTNAATAGQLLLANGNSTGASVTIQNPSTVTTGYNFNLPATAGANGALFVSGGGGSTASAWVTDVAAGQILTSGGTTSPPAYSATPTLGVNSTTTGTLALASAGGAATTISPSTATSTAWTLTLPTSGGTTGYCLTTSGASGVTSWASCGGGGGSPALSSITSATIAASFDNVGYGQTWTWNSLAGSSALSLTTSSTAATGNTQTMLNISMTGTNGTTGQTTYGEQISNAHGGSGTNVGLSATASGGTNNYAALFPSGNVGIGTTAPANPLTVNGIVQSLTGGFKFPDGTTQTTASASSKITVQSFTTSGTYTPNSHLVYASVRLVGSGGGGGGASSASGLTGCGSGGGAGAYAEGVFSAATIGSSQTVTIGAGGAAGTAGSNGGNGNQTSLGSLLTANGGSGGVGGTQSTGYSLQGGAGSNTTSGSSFAVAGASGGNCTCQAYNSSFNSGGVGGPSAFGGGGAGGSSSSGSAGVVYGSGGGGAGADAAGQSNSGAAGAPGVVVVTEYDSQ